MSRIRNSRLPRPYLDQYVRTPNRLAFGERTVIVMSSRVAQKSYGTEKRSADTLPIHFALPLEPCALGSSTHLPPLS